MPPPRLILAPHPAHCRGPHGEPVEPRGRGTASPPPAQILSPSQPTVPKLPHPLAHREIMTSGLLGEIGLVGRRPCRVRASVVRGGAILPPVRPQGGQCRLPETPNRGTVPGTGASGKGAGQVAPNPVSGQKSRSRGRGNASSIAEYRFEAEPRPRRVPAQPTARNPEAEWPACASPCRFRAHSPRMVPRCLARAAEAAKRGGGTIRGRLTTC